MENATRKCSGPCKRVLPMEAFARNAAKANGRQTECRDCRKEFNQRWRDANPDYWDEWYAANKTRRNEYQTNYVSNRKMEDLEGHRAYYRVHAAVKRAHGSASEYKCSCGCGKQAYDWALMSDSPDVKKSLHYTWSENVDDYVPLARACHRRYDSGSLVIQRGEAA